MIEKIKKHWDLSLVLGIGVIFIATGFIAMFAFTNPIYSQVSTSIVVTANVQEYLLFTSSAIATTLAPDPLDSSGILHVASSSNITLTVTTSSADGYSITVEGADLGLVSGGNNIGMTTASTTVATGTDAFGVQASTTVVGLTIMPNYMRSFDASTTAGRASTTAARLAYKNTSGTGETAIVRFLAACDAAQPSGTYTDTITFTAMPSIP